MSQLNDAKLLTLRTQLGLEGHINDLELLWVQALGATSGLIVDAWWEVFDAAAVPAGQFNDRAVAYILAEVGAPPSEDYNAYWLHYWENATLGPVVPTPPAQANLQHWWDGTNPLSRWNDQAGTIQAIQGDLVRKLDDGGLGGLDISEAGTGVPTLSSVPGGVNGLQVLNSVPTTGYFNSGVTQAFNAGMSMGHIVRMTSLAGSTTATFAYGSGIDGINNQAVIAPATGWRVLAPGAGFQDYGRLVAIEWLWMYMTIDAAGNWAIRISGDAEVSGAGVFSAQAAGGNLSMFGGNLQGAETLVWDKGLSVAERAAFIAYADAKYGVMPF